ncbi:MAG: hypothetical protein V1855_02420 [bacterium]
MKTKVYFFLAAILVSVGAYFFIHHSGLHHSLSRMASTALTKQKQGSVKHRLTVFVHGTFGTVMGFLSLADVVKDEVQGTAYKKMIAQMRKDPNFYSTQPILSRGLTSITPSFNPACVENKKYAAYPLIQAYQTISKEIEENGTHQDHFYTFGWSGLISQHRRRMEAIRLYNALAEEVKKFHKQGIEPEIHVVAHSHGGNLCLNLAAISHILNTKYISNHTKPSKHDDENESTQKMFEILETLPHKENALAYSGQKRFDYLPDIKDFKIDKLMMLGVPVQPETQYFCASPIFGKVYHFYSDQDDIQALDCVSTKRSFSDKRFDRRVIGAHTKLVQAKVMYDRDLTKSKGLAKANDFEKNEAPESSLLSKILNKLFSPLKTNKDPDHKELWFISWDQENSEPSSLFPLPTAVIIPLLLKTIDIQPLLDIDINISTSADKLCISLTEHGTHVIKNTNYMPYHVIDRIKQAIKKWKPDSISSKFKFDRLYNLLLKRGPHKKVAFS